MARSKLKKFAELKTFPNVLEKDDAVKLKGKWQKDFFKNKKKILIEVGCGHGVFALEVAKNFPEFNVIGIDKKGARIWKSAKEAQVLGVKNLAFVQTFVENLPDIFKKNEVSEIWITFPDPFLKPSKKKKMMVSERYLEIYKKILASKGVINLKTDNQQIFEYGLESAKKWHVQEVLTDLHSTSKRNEILKRAKIKTVYEKRFMDAGEKIKYYRISL